MTCCSHLELHRVLTIFLVYNQIEFLECYFICIAHLQKNLQNPCRSTFKIWNINLPYVKNLFKSFALFYILLMPRIKISEWWFGESGGILFCRNWPCAALKVVLPVGYVLHAALYYAKLWCWIYPLNTCYIFMWLSLKLFGKLCYSQKETDCQQNSQEQMCMCQGNGFVLFETLCLR